MKIIKNNNNKFLFNSYLTGLFQGDGHIWLPNNNAKKIQNPIFVLPLT